MQYKVTSNLKHDGALFSKDQEINGTEFDEATLSQLVTDGLLVAMEEAKAADPLVSTGPVAGLASEAEQTTPPPVVPSQAQAQAPALQNQGIHPSQSQIQKDLDLAAGSEKSQDE